MTAVITTYEPRTPGAARRRGPRLTVEQTQALKHLPADYELIAVRNSTPIVRRPDGRETQMRSSGQLVETGAIEGVKSYLLVAG